ncbi:hypothetical protein VTJ83DRAFT_4836 [Remersonia thermophila]|uniref:Uncharacterized protein n=1 Tax=Remersonia thermophila TaxID=72144 RepID=A0ABR4DBZ8_9PEZI
MPAYLCHGFRWQRRNIRVYVILQNLDDASPDWIIPARSSQYILGSFYEIFDFLPFCSPANGPYDPTREPGYDHDGRILDWTAGRDRSQSRARSRSQSQTRARSRSQSAAGRCHSRTQSRAGPHLLPPLPITAADDDDESAAEGVDDDFAAQSWSAVKLLEEYDPRDLSAVSRPYAYVADYAVRIDLSCNIAEEIARYEQMQLQSSYPAIGIPSSKNGGAVPEPGWFEKLRDELQRGEEIGWYVVVNNDEDRDWANDGCSEAELEPAGPPPAAHGHEQCRPHPYHPRSRSRSQLHRQQASYLCPTQPARPLPTIEQRHHHAQYLLQQKIFESIDQEAQAKEEPDQQPQDQEDPDLLPSQDLNQPQPQPQSQSQSQSQPQPQQKQSQPTPEQREQQRRQAEEELRRQKQLLFEKAEQKRREEQEQQRQRLQQQQLQHIAALREQELRKERERCRQKEKEMEVEKQQQLQQLLQRRMEESAQPRAQKQQPQERQPSPPRRPPPPPTQTATSAPRPRANTTQSHIRRPSPDHNGNKNNGTHDDDDDRPPAPPEKDHYYLSRPPTSHNSSSSSSTSNNNNNNDNNRSSSTARSHHGRRGTDASAKAPAMVIRPKMSFDAGLLGRPKMSFDGGSIARPKTPGSSIRMGSGGGSGGFRRLFGRGSRVAAVEGTGY